MKLHGIVQLVTAFVAALLLMVVARSLGLHRVLRDLEGARWSFVAAAAAINLLNTVVEAVRWRWLAMSAVPQARLRSALTGVVAGTLGNVVFPLKMGDGLRALVFGQAEQVPLAEAISTVVLDRLLDVSVFALLATVTSLVAPVPDDVELVVRTVLVGAVIGIGVLYAMARRERRGWHVDSGTPGRVRTELRRFAHGLSALRRSAYLGPALAMAVLSWGLKLALVETMLQAFNLHLATSAPAVVLTIINVGIAVAQTPANAGSFELASMTALGIYAVPEDLALSFATVLHVAEVLPIVVIGLLMLWTGRLRIGRAPVAATG